MPVLVLAAGLCVAAIATWQATATPYGGNDFQWSGAHLVARGTDPYAEALHGHLDVFALTQYPNYLPLLYVLLLPFGVLPLDVARVLWTGLNLAFLGVAVLLLAGGAGLSWKRKMVVLGCLLAAQPAITAVVNGQQTALVLAAAVLACSSSRGWVAGPALAVVLVKYSFAPIAVVLLLRRRWVALSGAALLEIAGAVIAGMLTGAAPWRMLLGPFLVSRHMGPGAGDLTTLLKQWRPSHDNLLAYTVALVACVALTWSCRRVLARGHWIDALALSSLICLACLPHLVYDYCFLLPVLVSAQRRRGWPSRVLMAGVLVPWFGWVVGFEPLDPQLVVAQICTLLALLCGVLLLLRTAGISGAGEAGRPREKGLVEVRKVHRAR